MDDSRITICAEGVRVGGEVEIEVEFDSDPAPTKVRVCRFFNFNNKKTLADFSVSEN